MPRAQTGPSVTARRRTRSVPARGQRALNHCGGGRRDAWCRRDVHRRRIRRRWSELGGRPAPAVGLDGPFVERATATAASSRPRGRAGDRSAGEPSVGPVVGQRTGGSTDRRSEWSIGVRRGDHAVSGHTIGGRHGGRAAIERERRRAAGRRSPPAAPRSCSGSGLAKS